MLQYDLIEVKPGQASSSAASHFLKQGYDMQQIKDYHSSLKFFTKACNSEKRNTSAWFCRGVAHDKVKDFFKALQDFTKCVEIEEEKERRNKYFSRLEDKREERKNKKVAGLGPMLSTMSR